MATSHTTTVSDGHTFALAALASSAGPSPAIYSATGWGTTRRFAPEFRISSKAASNNQSRRVTANFSFPNVVVEGGVSVVKSRINATLEWSVPDDIAAGTEVGGGSINAFTAADLFGHILLDSEIQAALRTGFAP